MWLKLYYFFDVVFNNFSDLNSEMGEWGLKCGSEASESEREERVMSYTLWWGAGAWETQLNVDVETVCVVGRKSGRVCDARPKQIVVASAFSGNFSTHLARI